MEPNVNHNDKTKVLKTYLPLLDLALLNMAYFYPMFRGVLLYILCT